ncbi:hypothetical protein [Desulfosudis oleivorans]|uniref:Porin n=1 Tax=Desulfosudis oleivorans (strain DSM 6200 / JCM 39069 / Hxd3) TaxID=96561 RepID=A8ZTC0_DESOH|nr:hypothetical protein [Desulfosudis oleivorans]ABW67803.1 conserved hypothetical protein [Desulfosudis oleivorans Hxd3]
MKHSIKTLLISAMAVFLLLPASAGGMTLEDLQIHGFISQGFLYSTDDVDFLAEDSHEGTFEFNEMAINFSATPTDDLSVGVQLAAFDLGTIGNDEVMVDWAFGDYSFRDYLGLRAGIMKIPFGLYNDVRKIDMVRTSILLPNSVYPEWFRESFARMKGVGLYGTLPGNISYQAMYGTVDIQADGGLAEGMETLNGSALGMMNTDSTDTDYAYAGKIQWDSAFGLKLGASLYALHGLKMDMNSTTYMPAPPLPVGLPLSTNLALDFEPIESYVLSAEYMIDRLTVMAEYVENDMEFTGNLTTNLDPVVSAAMGIPSRLGDKTTTQGYYGGASYRVLDQMEIGAYYSELYYDKSDHDGDTYAAKFGVAKHNAWLKDTCLSARYDFSANWCAKIEAHLMDGGFMASGADAKNWELYAAKLTYSF